jgi:ribosomal-protein-alanine N-acetyltransferase
MDGIWYRGYRSGDLEAMFRLDVVCFEEPFRFSRGAMRRFAEDRRARVVIAETEGEMVGFVVLHVEDVGVPHSSRFLRQAQDRAMNGPPGDSGKVGYVVTLDVATAWRRKGVAGELMSRVEAEAREAGCEAMMLHVFEGNWGARRFYERVGYEVVGVAKAFYGVGVDAVVCGKAVKSE